MTCKLTILDSVLSSVHSICDFRAKNEFNDLNKGNKVLKGKFIYLVTNTTVYYIVSFLCTNINYLSHLKFRQMNFKFQKSIRKNKSTWLLFKTIKFASLNSPEP